MSQMGKSPLRHRVEPPRAPAFVHAAEEVHEHVVGLGARSTATPTLVPIGIAVADEDRQGKAEPVAVERPPRLAYDDSLETPVMLGPGGEMRSLLQKPL